MREAARLVGPCHLHLCDANPRVGDFMSILEPTGLVCATSSSTFTHTQSMREPLLNQKIYPYF